LPRAKKNCNQEADNMLKLRIALGLALVVGTLTLTNGVLHDARMSTIVYRVVISIVLFGILGYVLAIVGERFYREIVEKNTTPGQDADVVNEQQINEEIASESEFSPFVSDNFEQISRPKE